MTKLVSFAVASLFAANFAFAQAPAAAPVAAPATGCEAKAISKDGKPLAGAAKAASIKKCEKDAAAAK